MNRTKHYINLVFFTLLVFESRETFGQKHQPIIHISKTLDFVRENGHLVSYYELQVSNASPDTITFTKISTIDINNLSVLFTSAQNDLKNRLHKIGLETTDTSPQLVPGSSAIIYLELNLENSQTREIAHRLYFHSTGDKTDKDDAVQSATTIVASTASLVVGPPLAGGLWAAVFEPSWEKGHRRVIYTDNGIARIPGRYAIDFIRIDSNGRYATGDENIINNWIGYGAVVLAVADGVVASTKNDFSESPTLSGHSQVPAQMATGNYVSINIGDNRFAFYEHLKPGSIKVMRGEKIKKGDTIASVGFTGQSTGPHLHFHISDKDTPLGAEGLPFEFESFDLLGAYPEFRVFGKSPWTPIKNARQITRKKERPTANSVIRFSPN